MSDFTTRSRFLSRLAAPELQAVLAAATRRQCRANSVITRQDEAATQLFLVATGRARHYFTTPDGRKVLMQWLAPGDIFGAAALLETRSTYRVSTETVRDSCLLTWSRAAIRILAQSHPRLLENMLLIGADYVDWYLAAQVALTCHSARERLAGVLVSLAPLLGRAVRDGVELAITNDELANAANITPYTASRLLNEWQRQRVVIKRRGRVVLRAPHQLFAHAS